MRIQSSNTKYSISFETPSVDKKSESYLEIKSDLFSCPAGVRMDLNLPLGGTTQSNNSRTRLCIIYNPPLLFQCDPRHVHISERLSSTVLSKLLIAHFKKHPAPRSTALAPELYTACKHESWNGLKSRLRFWPKIICTSCKVQIFTERNVLFYTVYCILSCCYLVDSNSILSDTQGPHVSAPTRNCEQWIMEGVVAVS